MLFVLSKIILSFFSKKGITNYLLPNNYGNLSLPLSWGKFWGSFAVFIIKIAVNCCQMITLNSHFGLFTPFNGFMRSFL